MQQQPLTSCSRKTNIETRTSLDIALTKPDDVELFYTASLHFLKQRLNEKLLSGSIESHQTTKGEQSSENLQTSTKEQRLKSLSMHEILPYPKSKRVSFLARVMNSFRKHRKYNDIAENKTDDIGVLSTTSNCKLPNCERFSKVYSSHLKSITEETSNKYKDFQNKKCNKNTKTHENSRQYLKQRVYNRYDLKTFDR